MIALGLATQGRDDMDRRWFLGGLATLGLAACDKKPSAGDAPAPAASASAAASGAPAAKKLEGELLLFAWSEYVPQEVLDGFAKETGVKVKYETYASNEEMLSKLLAGGARYDLIQPSEYMVEALAKKSKLAKLDRAKLPNAKNLLPEYRGLPHDPGDQWGVPYMAGTVGIAVNTDKIKDPIKGYKDVFSGKHKGRIVVVADAREIVSWALSSLSIDINDVTPDTLAKARPVLEKWLPQVKVFDSDSPKTAMLNGDVDVGVIFSGEAAALIKANKKFTYVLPEEGVHRFIDYLCIPTTAKNPDAAHAFVDYVLRPEVSRLISDKFPYTNPNGEARKLLSPEAMANVASYPIGVGKLATFRDIGKVASDVDKLVTDLRAKSK